MRNIDKYFLTPAPEILFHYTGIGSLLGMGNSGSVWASNAYYLNDSREVIHACDILSRNIRARLESTQANTPESAFLDQLNKWSESFKTTHHNVFIFSLSEERSLLSQWRSYTPHGKGVSIGFSTTAIESMTKSSASVLAKCVYDPNRQQEVIIDLIEMILQTFRQEISSIDVSQSHPSQSYFKFLEKFRGDFLKVLCLIKHSAFSEEKEWRIISPYFAAHTAPQIKFREGASMLVPFIEIHLPKVRPIFKEVVLGPSQHQNLSMSALSAYLTNTGQCSTTVNCTIPYREW